VLTPRTINSYQLTINNAVAALAMALLCSCAAPNTTTTTFSRDAKTGAILVESPKDITITGLDAQLPDGTKIKLKSLKSKGNVNQTKAQGERERKRIEAASKLAGEISKGVTEGAVKGVKGF
jgi:type IV pilus biogenesis protein CpaD/CtpE